LVLQAPWAELGRQAEVYRARWLSERSVNTVAKAGQRLSLNDRKEMCFISTLREVGGARGEGEDPMSKMQEQALLAQLESEAFMTDAAQSAAAEAMRDTERVRVLEAAAAECLQVSIIVCCILLSNVQ
jgi:hypothetical protein